MNNCIGIEKKSILPFFLFLFVETKSRLDSVEPAASFSTPDKCHSTGKSNELN